MKSELFVIIKQTNLFILYFSSLNARKSELLAQEKLKISTFQQELAVARVEREALLQQQHLEIGMLKQTFEIEKEEISKQKTNLER